MRAKVIFLGIAIFFLVCSGSVFAADETPTPTDPPVSTPTPTSVPSVIDTPTPTIVVGDTPTPTDTPKITPTPTTIVPTISPLPTIVPTDTPAPTNAATPSPTSPPTGGGSTGSSSNPPSNLSSSTTSQPAIVQAATAVLIKKNNPKIIPVAKTVDDLSKALYTNVVKFPETFFSHPEQQQYYKSASLSKIDTLALLLSSFTLFLLSMMLLLPIPYGLTFQISYIKQRIAEARYSLTSLL